MSVYILSGSRTPSGSFLGTLKSESAPKLGATAITGALGKVGLDNKEVDEVFMGTVLPAGQGQAPARQAALFAELPNDVPCTTVNKVCGSGMKTILMGAQSILAGDNQLVVSGGMENMSQAPHLMVGSRLGHKFGQVEMKDHMQWDGLWDVYNDQAMGNCAEECVKKYNFSRAELDEFAINSFKKASAAQDAGHFSEEITPVKIKSRKGEVLVEHDEGPKKANFEKIPTLRPAFTKDGSITAANASSINDGAAAVILGGEKFKDKAKFRIVAYAGHAGDPVWFTTAPVMAMNKAIDKSGLNLSDIGLFEINEAFAVVTMASIRELALPADKVNVYGGAIALGHPIGCSGTRIVVTMMNAMEKNQTRYGMASICIGGGEALALIIEQMN